MSNYNVKVIILRQYNLVNNWHAACSTPATRSNIHRAFVGTALRMSTAHVEIRKILPECWHIFFHCVSHRIWETFLPRPMEDLAGRICYWCGIVCKLPYKNCYPKYSAYISVTISLSWHTNKLRKTSPFSSRQVLLHLVTRLLAFSQWLLHLVTRSLSFSQLDFFIWLLGRFPPARVTLFGYSACLLQSQGSSFGYLAGLLQSQGSSVDYLAALFQPRVTSFGYSAALFQSRVTSFGYSAALLQSPWISLTLPSNYTSLNLWSLSGA